MRKTMNIISRISRMRPMSHIRPIGHISLISLMCLIASLALTGCYREPPLHLYDWENPAINVPMVDLNLDLYWDYGFGYDWRAEWYYGKHDQPGGWDDEDRRIFGEFGYQEPTDFYVYRYFTGDEAYGKRLSKREAYITGRNFRAPYDWGYWDILVWNDIHTIDGVQSIDYEEKASLDEPIYAFTNQTMYSSRYHAPRFLHSFYEPEQLFAACERGIDIDENLNGFVYEEENNVWVKNLHMMLEPLTYIYLPQIILRHNINPATGTRRIKPDVESGGVQVYDTNLSGLARNTNLNTGVAGPDAIAVRYQMRYKEDMDYIDGEKVDIIGGRLMTFGICGQNANRITRADDGTDTEHHYLDIDMRFYNDMDSTFVFDVTDQVRQRYKGGVITIVLDMDTVPTPVRPGGSGFDAIVKEFDEETHEIEL